MSDLLGRLTAFGLSAGIIVFVVAVLYFIHRQLLVFFASRPAQQHVRQLLMAIISLLALVAAVLSMPIADDTRGDLLIFLGVLFSATIALSSTAFVGNVMAGYILRSLRAYRVGDHIRVGEYSGKVLQMDLLHVRLETAAHDFAALPNLYLVTNPVTLVSETNVRQPQPPVEVLPDKPREKAEPSVDEQPPSDPDADSEAAAITPDQQALIDELESLKHDYTEGSQRLLELERELKEAGQGDERRPLLLEKKKLEASLARLGRQIEQLKAELRH